MAITAAISGMGGVGKTELAVQYVQRYLEHYPGGICWLQARSTNLEPQIIEFAQLILGLTVPTEQGNKILTLQEQVAWCWQHWQPPGNVLLVLDDVTNLENCWAALPTLSRFRILLTSRERGLDPTFAEVSLEVLLPEKALELLTSLVGQARVNREPKAAEQLCEWLGYLPLGLELVGRYLAKDRVLALSTMQQRLTLQDEALDKNYTSMTGQRGVRAAFELSWQALDSTTAEVAMLLSLFAPDVIPWWLVELAVEQLPDKLETLNAIRQQLDNLHLMQPVDGLDESYKIHPLIREFLQTKLSQSEQAPSLRRAVATAAVVVAQQIPQSPTRELIESASVAIPHLVQVTQNLTSTLSNEDLLWPFVGLGRFYQGQGLYTLAEPYFQQCLKTAQDCFGADHPAVAASLNNLALLYESQGRYAEAEPLYLQALELSRQLLGEQDLAVAVSLNNLALLYKSQGRYAEAEPLYLQALELNRQLLGEQHPVMSSSLNNLALLYESQGRYAEAEPLYLQALKLNRQLLGEQHPDVATSLNNLAALYKSQGRYTEAEPLFVQALKLRCQLLGEQHPDVATSLNSLALLYFSQGRYAEVEPLFIQALELRHQFLGKQHPAVAASLNNLAGLYDSQRRYAEAEPLYLQALQLTRQLLGGQHPDVATSLNNLAFLYKSQGRYAEAEPLYLQALKLRRQLLGEQHPDVATSLNNLAALYKSQGRYTEAEPLYLQALQLAEQILGSNHPNTVTLRQNLAILRAMQSQKPKRSVRRSLFRIVRELTTRVMRLVWRMLTRL